jgi:flagellar basal-body rod protein FlgF
MIRGLYSAASGLNAMSVMQDVTARNISNASKPGYQRYVAKFETQGPNNNILGTRPSVHTDFSQGPLVHTGDRLDMALQGPGFFAVRGPIGTMYTRSGVFETDAQGNIVSPEGFALLDTQGQPMRVPPDTGEILVTDDGAIAADTIPIGRIQAARFSDPNQLIRVGTSLYQPPPGMEAQIVPAAVKPGYREMSNASHISEMVQLMSGYRHFEASQRALRALDESIQSRTDPRR